MQQLLEKWNGPTYPQPTKPGRYIGREVSVDMMGHKILTWPHEVEVVADVPNERNHKLLVKTGSIHPKYKSLDLYEWQI